MKAIKLFLFTLIFTVVSPVTYGAYQDNGDGTVTDTTTKLMWQRCTAPSEEISCSLSAALYTWDDALAYCNGLILGGYTNWRTPNVKVLHSILDAVKTTDPTINTDYFPDTQAAYYWSSTTFTGTPSYAWYVDFSIGIAMTSPISKQNTHYLRCVR